MNRPLRAAVPLTAACLFAAAAAPAVVLLSVKDERAIGRRAQAAMVARTPRVADRSVQDLVKRIGVRLVRVADGPAYDYSFDVADYADLNALALPGGHVWVFRGAISASTHEAALAGVIAHEVAHLTLRHAAQQLSDAIVANAGLDLLGALLGNVGGAETSRAAAAAMAGTLMLGYSRADELAADREGARLLARAGWDPRGLLDFLEAARTLAGRDPGAVEVFFSTHPALQDRIARLRRGTGRPGGRRDSGACQAVRRRLARLPPARRAPAR